MYHLRLGEDGVDVVGVTSAHEEVVGLVTVGDDGQKAARNKEPHSGHRLLQSLNEFSR